MTTLFMMIFGLVLVSLLLTGLWLWQRKSGNAGIADAGWTSGMALLTLWYAIFLAPHTARTGIIAALTVLWALRLTHHIIFYRVKGRKEDGRYSAMRDHWGDKAQQYFFWFFQGQAVAAFLFTLPILAALTSRVTWSLWDTLGLLIFVSAIAGEAIADQQLETFRTNSSNRGKTCRIGLWRYSRHPNYFFEWIHWFAYVAFAVGHPVWWATWLGPIVMLIFLLKLTGIPYTEKQALKSRGDDYRAYQRTTSVFFPWFPKKDKR